MKRIEDYALIGDGETAALVGRDATIEWLCMPRFDSPACFAALLGNQDNGCWRMAPTGDGWRIERSYRKDSLILETIFSCDKAEVAVIDFMPIRGEAPDIVRIVEGSRGSATMTSDLALRFEHGRTHPLVRDCEGGRMLAIAGPNGIALDFDTPIDHGDRSFSSRFTVGEGDRFHFVMTWYPAHRPPPRRVDGERAFKRCRAFWSEWLAGASPGCTSDPLVARSLIVLKALIHRPTGGMVAAPTASLPERRGGQRNWDYRFCWLRDSTLTLLALLHAGLDDDARAWIGWLERTVAGEPIELQPLYSVAGDRTILEWEAPWLSGYEGARPVRFGNGAVDQLQLDIYDDILDTLHVAADRGIIEREGFDRLICLLAEALAHKWRSPDAGMWEARGPEQHHVYSKIMCWVAFDRASRWFSGRDPKEEARWADLARKVRAEVMAHGLDETSNHFVATFGGRELDAALLRIPMVGFLPAADPHVAATVAKIEDQLIRDGLVVRYDTDKTDDGLAGSEGAFLPASLWLVEVYILQGRQADARALFDRVAGLSNDLGLLSEEADEHGLLGNFPQALTHLALVSAAIGLRGSGGPTNERAAQSSG